jgi:uncharacterized protein involved in outer membrane biogenesis
MKKKKRTPSPSLPSLTPMATPPPRSNRWRRRVLIGVAIYAVIGFFIVPAIIKWQLRKQLPALSLRQAEVKQVRVNPFALSLTIRGLALTETNGTPFVAFDEFYANFQLSSIFRGAWTFDEIRLVHPTAKLVRLADGNFNFSNLLSTNQPATTNPPSAPPSLLIRTLLVTNALVTVTDEMTEPDFHTTYGPINVDMTDFNTHRDAEEPYSIIATTTEGETFAWSGRFSLRQLRSRGQFKLSGIPPHKYRPYAALFTTAQIQQGTLDLGATYRVNLARNPVELEATNAYVQLRNLIVKAPEHTNALLALESLKIANASASLTGRVAHVSLMEINGGSTFLERDTNGQPVALSYLKLPKAEATPLATAAAQAAAPALADIWQLRLEELIVTNFNVAVEDHSTVGVATIGLDNLAVNLKGLSSQSNAPIALTVGFDWRGGGSVHTDVRGTVLPPDLSATLAISNLAIPVVQPYLAQFLNLVIHTGDLNLHGVATFNPVATPQIHFTGDSSVTNFSSSDTVAYHELASWQNHSIRGIDFALNPPRLSIEEIKFVGARNNIVISSNGQVNVVALAKLPANTNTNIAATATTNAAPAPTELFPIHVGAIVLENNSFRAADDSLLRRFEMHVEDINGSIRDITLPGLNKASVDIRGKVTAVAPFEITGSVTPDPNNLFVDLKVAFTNTDLTPLSPYTEKFVGRPLTRGKLTTELIYHIENRNLAGTNIVDLAQLTLGGRVESPFATKLPVKLAIGLMKDSDGHILLDLPVSGSLDDPQFSIWGLVGQALQNMILKIAASPFSLLGALVGGGEELQFVDFDPGLTQLPDSQTNKLFTLVAALHKRPALTLEVGATFDAVLDVDALGRQKVAERMKTSRIEEIVARGKPAPARSELQLDDTEYDRLLRKEYRAAFNTTPEQALYDKLAAVLAATSFSPNTPSPPPSPTTDRTQQKGAALLMGMNRSLAQMAAASQSGSGGTNASAGVNLKTKTEKELVRDELEQRLATLAPVTTGELRTLMQRRIETVQRFLVEQATIEADRVLPTTPNPEDPNRKGAARVVFSLD